MLSNRQQNVLHILIKEYVARALPVGSRTLVERYNLGISAATVRNELSSLEEEGYLTQPHTSSGRIPTDSGYRAFVDDLLSREKFEDEKLVASLRECAGELDELMEKMSLTLARLTDCMTLLVPPRALSFSIKMINLVELSFDRLLVVVITDEGKVFNRQIDIDAPVEQAVIQQTQELLNRTLSGKSLTPTMSLSSLGAANVQNSLFETVFEEILICIKEQTIRKPHPLGMTRLLCQPEFSQSARILPVLEQLEDDTMLLHIFDEAFHSEVPLVRIGKENNYEALSGVSLVASQFGKGGEQGLIAIVGPTRMDYSQVFKAVRAAKSVLQDI